MVTDLYIVEISNLTTGSKLFSEGGKKLIELIEFDSDHIKFNIGKAVGKGQLVSIDGRLLVKDSAHVFAISGKVVSTKGNEDKSIEVSVEMHNFDKDLWGEFLSVKREQQERVELLLKEMKGEA